MKTHHIWRRASEEPSAVIEALEQRQLLSASLVTAFVSPVAPRVPIRGHNEVAVRVRNVGTPARGAVSVKIYLSADATLDSGDRLLAMRPAQEIALAHNKAHPFLVRLAAPRDTPTGGYYLFAVAQAGSGFAGAIITSAPRPAIVVNVIHPHGHSDGGGGDDIDDSGYDDSGYDDTSTSSGDTDDSNSSDTTPSGDDSSAPDSGYDASGSDFLVRRGQ